MNLANKITVVRLFLIPVFLLFMSNPFAKMISISFDLSTYIATGIFLIAALTDKLDGYVARKCNQVTNLGKLLDPLVDKLLISSALICLVGHHKLGSWIAVVIVCREFMITLLRIMAIRRKLVIAADRYGKYKLVLQVFGVLLILMNDKPLDLIMDIPYGQLTMIAAVGMTLYSGLNYFVKNKHVLEG